MCLTALAALLFGGNATAADALSSACTDQAAESSRGVLRLLSLNTSHGRNTALNQLLVSKKRTYENLDAIGALLAATGAEVVALQEADGPSRWSGGFDHVNYLVERTGYACFVHGLHSISWMAAYGTALLSQTRLLSPTSLAFKPSPPSKQKGLVTAALRWDTATDKRLVTVVSVHLDFLGSRTRDRQIAELIAHLGDVDGPLIVLGDLNSEWDTKGSQVQQLGNDLGLIAFEPENDDLGTYKTQKGKRLDWILISKDLEFLRYDVLPDVVADHFAVYAEVTFKQELER
jgi:endonuclease/exonuclease/phosphatase family metal-dependent hydrolase